MNAFDTSEYKVTYLIGAGASAKALPTIKTTSTTSSLSQAINHFGDILKSDTTIGEHNKINAEKLAADLYWLSKNSAKFGTPDTFAKYLYLQERNSLKRLKNALSAYFTYEQYVNNKFDDRTLSFLTSVMQIGNVFPTNIKILNWNYDFQIQIAGEVFKKEAFFNNRGTTKRSFPLVEYYPGIGHSFDTELISMVHLNGLAGLYFCEINSLILNDFLNKSSITLNELIENATANREKKHELLTFAWEKETEASHYLQKRMSIATTMIKETNILVIIGYSFPFFNRAIDKQIFDSLKESKKLDKIYYQDPNRTGDFLKRQFELSDDIEVIHIKDTENYFIPTEL